MMERKAYTAFGKTGFGKTGRHRPTDYACAFNKTALHETAD